MPSSRLKMVRSPSARKASRGAVNLESQFYSVCACAAGRPRRHSVLDDREFHASGLIRDYGHALADSIGKSLASALGNGTHRGVQKNQLR